jgi:putative tricarboxylic transport membrane protein
VREYRAPVRVRALLAAALAAAAVAVAGCGQKAAEYGGTAESWPVRDLRIMAPAEPGGGWDSTARAMAQAIERGKIIDKNVEVYNVAGAGGTIGLAELVSRNRRRANELMLMGLVMVGAIATNDAPVGLGDVTPIASLTTEPAAIVVREDSPYRDVDDLVADMRRDPRKVAFAGGSAGGTDQLLVGLVAKAAKIDPSKPKYVAYSGGGDFLERPFAAVVLVLALAALAGPVLLGRRRPALAEED